VKIFITGVAGFLGSHLAGALAKQGHTVRGLDNLIGGDRENIPEGVSFAQADIQDIPFLLSAFEDIDVVYHCAALPHEGLSVFSPKLITDSVFGGSMSVMSAACEMRVKRVINMSSMARYGNCGGAADAPFNETDPAIPVDPYGVAKLAAEDAMTILGKVHGVHVIHCVPHNIIGPNQKYDDPYRNVVSIFINKMLRGERPIVYGDGSQVRCFSYVEDDLQVMLQMLDAEVPHGSIWNVGPDEEAITIRDIGTLLGEVLEVKWDPEYVPDRPQEVRIAFCLADKIRAQFGYKTEWTLRDALYSMVAAIKKRGPKPFDYHLPLEIVNEKTPRTWVEKRI